MSADRDAALLTKTARAKPTFFLDLDDVLCLSHPFGGFDVIDIVNGKHQAPQKVYEHLFFRSGIAALRQVHDAMNGGLRYVISSSWREVLDREQMAAVFRQSGLPFVADALHERAWCTPLKLHRGRRVDEIADWLDRHHQGESFAIVDDHYSGASLAPALTISSHPFRGRVVLCEERVGLGGQHVQALVDALERPLVASAGDDA